MKRNNKIKVFYTEKQVNLNKNIISTTSRSPLKPYLLMKAFEGTGIGQHLEVDGSFEPLTNEDFKKAHIDSYVEGFFNGTPGVCTRNSLPWSPELAASVRYTNSSLYNALRHAYLNPEQVCFSPTSGFHHAGPSGGAGFCTFAGQVIAAVKLYEEFKISGAVLDLDGHFGNSIEDCRGYAKDLDLAIPRGFNVNPRGNDEDYHAYLVAHLSKIETAVLNNEIQYVMWCHGADSHEIDDLGGQVSTEWWVQCSKTFYAWVAQLDAKLEALGRTPLPVTLSLFGGYRKDDYGSVISLHVKDTVECLNTLCGQTIKYEANVSKKKYELELWIDGMPLSVLKMIDKKYLGKDYMSDVMFSKTKMSANEIQLIEFFRKNVGTTFNGNDLGRLVKQWKNHSMAKWAKLLIKRGLVVKTKVGFRLNETAPDNRKAVQAFEDLKSVFPINVED